MLLDGKHQVNVEQVPSSLTGFSDEAIPAREPQIEISPWNLLMYFLSKDTEGKIMGPTYTGVLTMLSGVHWASDKREPQAVAPGSLVQFIWQKPSGNSGICVFLSLLEGTILSNRGLVTNAISRNCHPFYTTSSIQVFKQIYIMEVILLQMYWKCFPSAFLLLKIGFEHFGALGIPCCLQSIFSLLGLTYTCTIFTAKPWETGPCSGYGHAWPSRSMN